MQSSNGNAVTCGAVTILDGDTYLSPNDELVRAFVDLVGVVIVITLHCPEEWAGDDLHTFQADGTGRVTRVAGTRTPEPIEWTLADLRPGDAAAWDQAVTDLGGQPWLPMDTLPGLEGLPDEPPNLPFQKRGVLQ